MFQSTSLTCFAYDIIKRVNLTICDYTLTADQFPHTFPCKFSTCEEMIRSLSMLWNIYQHVLIV